MKALDITGQRFGRLVAIKPLESTKQGIKWAFKCDCGKDYVKFAKAVKINADKKSCGCLQKEIYSNRCKTLNRTHGMTYTPEWNSWVNMKDRCSNPNAPKYHHYGGRGITIFNEWLKFENFFKDMGNRPKGTTLDRINVNGNYEPGNCRWATHLEQRHNRRK